MEASTIAGVLGGLLAALYGLLGILKIVGTDGMRQRAEHVHLSANAYRRIGVLEVLAAIGLIVGMFWTPAGVAAALGLLVLMAGAFIAHIRAKAAVAELIPAVLFAAVVAAYLFAI